MKKLISLSLALILCLALFIPVFAAEQGCNHVPNGYPIKQTTKYKPAADGCILMLYSTYKCENCNALFEVAEVIDSGITHISRLHSATCDGTNQNIVYRCGNCGYITDSYSRSCPGGPHTGQCRWLPV
ncbi:MAG: hypothetical protein IJA17_05690 [Oscillospiraceae bacterium]|nr:hypothetical protein [Oscillospiraceae bacterium]